MSNELKKLTLTIIEIPPDFSHLTTTDRLLELIRIHPDGLTIKELADTLNRPVSMLQICLKILIVSHQVTVKRQNNGDRLVTTYILKPIRTQPEYQFQLLISQGSRRIAPVCLRENAGLTKAQLAAELGLNIRTINDWEENRSQPKLVPSQLKQMMSVYQCTLDELIEAFE